MAQPATNSTDTAKKSNTAGTAGNTANKAPNKKAGAKKKLAKKKVVKKKAVNKKLPVEKAEATKDSKKKPSSKSNGSNGVNAPPTTTSRASAEAKAVKGKKNGTNRGSRNRAGRRIQEKREPKPTASRTYPVVRETVQLDHSIAQGSYDRYFDSFRSTFFHCTSVLGSCGIAGGADQVNAYILDLIENARTEMENETARITKVIANETGQNEVPRSAPAVSQRTAEIPCYLVRKYLTLFPAADRLIDAIVYAEIVGTMKWERRLGLLNLVKKYLRSPWGRYHSIAQKLLARQKHHHKNIHEARKEIRKVLDEALANHRDLKRVEQKRPMANTKKSSAG